MKKVLIVAAHPDDEVLGCGGTVARHMIDGDEVHIVILVEGVTSRDKTRNSYSRSKELSCLNRAAHDAKELLGATSLTFHNLPDNRLDSVDLLDITKLIEAHLDLVKPEIVYTHHVGDLNIDHRRVHEAVVTACRPLPGQTVRSLLFFEVPSSTEWQSPGIVPFTPNWFVDISETLELKMKALEAYSSEMRLWPHARSMEAVEHLARWRGSMAGCAAAEAFVVGRHISGAVDI